MCNVDFKLRSDCDMLGLALVMLLFRRWLWFIDSSDCSGTSSGTCSYPYHHPTAPTGPEDAEDCEVCLITIVLIKWYITLCFLF